MLQKKRISAKILCAEFTEINENQREKYFQLVKI